MDKKNKQSKIGDRTWDMQIYDAVVWTETKGRVVSVQHQVLYTLF
jgi:hypothetical protein